MVRMVRRIIAASSLKHWDGAAVSVPRCAAPLSSSGMYRGVVGDSVEVKIDKCFER